jgi:hypothetical protein
LRVTGARLSGHQQEVAHIDAGAKNPRWGKLGFCVHICGSREISEGLAQARAWNAAKGTSLLTRYHRSSSFGEAAFCGCVRGTT